MEHALAEVWRELLHITEVFADDDFFALGGHSLLVTKVVARIADRLDVRLTIGEVFEGPTINELAALVTKARGAADVPPIEPAGPGPQPLSFAQQRLWFLDQLAPGGSLYNVALVLDFEGTLDADALDRAVRAVVRRHAALRTRLIVSDDGPRQVVDDADVRIDYDDLRHLPADERGPRADIIVRSAAERPFDLAGEPPLRVRLIRLGEECHRLLLTMHHAVSDDWSAGLLLRDLGRCYASAPLPALPIQYADYAVWQRRLLEGGVRERQLAYWKRYLEAAPASLDLPTDRGRPPVSRHVGETFFLVIPSGLTSRLTEVSRAQRATRFMTLLAVFQLLLGRYAGVADVSVGTPVAGRTRPELEDVVGFFVNTVVVRTAWTDDPAFVDFLDRVRAGVLGAFVHQDVPFEQVVEALKPPRDPSRTPLFQVMLAMQNLPAHSSAFPGLTVTAREPAGSVAKFDLTVAWEEEPLESGELRGSVEYDVDLFDRETVERMMRHYVTLLESALGAPQAQISTLSMVPPGQVDAAFDPVVPARPAEVTLHDLVSAAAARWPDRTALVHEGRSLTYAELETASNAVCGYLRGRGVSLGATVVVSMDRGLAWPIALLGVMKAGAAYVPVDPSTPSQRFRHVVRDSQAVLVLGSQAAGAPASGTAPFVPIEEACQSGSEQPTASSVPLSALAYVLYTSGTTGPPKGVCVTHANLVHTICAVAERYAIEPDDRVLQFAALSFDVAAEEVFATLACGAAVVMPPSGPPPGIEELVTLTARERLTVLNLPASYWHEWVSVLRLWPLSSCPALRLVIVGSERVDAARLAEWQALAPPRIRWLNAYGPTEATITATVHEPSAAEPSSGATVPIGQPLPGVRAYVLDAALRPVPQGVPGELYLAGRGVSRGYLGDPVRTAERFVPDLWGAPGERMYATGDRARRGRGGVIEFLGRADNQVKLRGFRIETGEIEAALAAHPQVRDAVVILRADMPGQPRLVGYVSGRVSVAELRAHLVDRLPGYMIPAAVVVLDRLPRGEHGKVDQRALPAPASGGTATTAPAGEWEHSIAAIWREVLDVDYVGVDDNFFDLGGHSLLVMRVQARLSAALGTKVPVVDLFQFPTVRTLARRLAGDGAPASAEGVRGSRRAEVRKTRTGTRSPRRRAATRRETSDE
ncbi:amino acid adenylation domain-containing protein [Microbispora amethystogenes]|uniref:non-ribosomal peptide synthetase n=1 Tax=Microbispora amethystogenes TaxID=1427754 RepID=UPI0034021D78